MTLFYICFILLEGEMKCKAKRRSIKDIFAARNTKHFMRLSVKSKNVLKKKEKVPKNALPVRTSVIDT